MLHVHQGSAEDEVSWGMLLMQHNHNILAVFGFPSDPSAETSTKEEEAGFRGTVRFRAGLWELDTGWAPSNRTRSRSAWRRRRCCRSGSRTAATTMEKTDISKFIYAGFQRKESLNG